MLLLKFIKAALVFAIFEITAASKCGFTMKMFWSDMKFWKATVSNTPPTSKEAQLFTPAHQKSSLFAQCEDLGCDQRFPCVCHGVDHWAESTRADEDKSFKKLDVIKSLAERNLMDHEKISRISEATIEGLLPTKHFSSKSVKPMALGAGGLLDDWKSQ